jgi:hypothetical protein
VKAKLAQRDGKRGLNQTPRIPLAIVLTVHGRRKRMEARSPMQSESKIHATVEVTAVNKCQKMRNQEKI